MMLALLSTVLLALIRNNPLLSLGAFWSCAGSSLILGAVLVILHKWDGAPNHQMMVVRDQNPQLEPVQEILHQMGKGMVQSKNVFADSFELVYELQMQEKEEEKLLAYISNMEGISGVNILAPETKVA